MAETIDAINHLTTGNNVEFQNTIDQLLKDRVRETIANHKMVVANQIFNGDEGIEDEEEVLDDTESTAEDQ